MCFWLLTLLTSVSWQVACVYFYTDYKRKRPLARIYECYIRSPLSACACDNIIQSTIIQKHIKHADAHMRVWFYSTLRTWISYKSYICVCAHFTSIHLRQYHTDYTRTRVPAHKRGCFFSRIYARLQTDDVILTIILRDFRPWEKNDFFHCVSKWSVCLCLIFLFKFNVFIFVLGQIGSIRRGEQLRHVGSG